MNSCVVYESFFGNTELVARAVARGMGDPPVLDAGQTTAADLARMDLIVLGGPTHAFTMTRPSTRQDAHEQGATQGSDQRGLRELIAELPGELPARMATFDTRVAKVKRLPGSAAKAAAKELRRHHHTQVIAHMSFYVDDTSGPLLEGELDRALTWGKSLLSEPASPDGERPARS